MPDGGTIKRESEEAFNKTANAIMVRIKNNPLKPKQGVNWYKNPLATARAMLKSWQASVPKGREAEADYDEVSIVKGIELIWHAMKERKHVGRNRKYIREVFGDYHRLFLKMEGDQAGPAVMSWRIHVSRRLAHMVPSDKTVTALMNELLNAPEENEIFRHFLKDEMRGHSPATVITFLKRYTAGYHRLIREKRLTAPQNLAAMAVNVMDNMGLTTTRDSRSLRQNIWRRMNEEYGASRSRSKSEDPKREDEMYERKRKRKGLMSPQKRDTGVASRQKIRDLKKAILAKEPGAFEELQRFRATLRQRRVKKVQAWRGQKAGRPYPGRPAPPKHPTIPGESQADRKTRLGKEARARRKAAKKDTPEVKEAKDKGIWFGESKEDRKKRLAKIPGESVKDREKRLRKQNHARWLQIPLLREKKNARRRAKKEKEEEELDARNKRFAKAARAKKKKRDEDKGKK